MRPALARPLVAIVVVAITTLVSAGVASAHPLGNSSTNHYAGLVVGEDETSIDYVLDLAELPTVREKQAIDADGDGSVDRAERTTYEADRCRELAAGLRLDVDGAAAAIRSTGGALRFIDGAAGLETMRLECDLVADAPVTSRAAAVSFRNGNARDRGWSEVTAVGDGVTLDSSDVPTVSVSSRLTAYPESGPVDVASASLAVSPGGPSLEPAGATPFGERARAATDRFTSLIAADEITVPLVATSLVVAIAFGALHSLAPGHGKSVIAAYLVGQQRDRRLAFLLGGTVAVTHTASVLLFGAVISLTETAAPDRFYPLFGLVSGLLFVSLGVVLLRQVAVRHRTSREVAVTAVAPAPAPRALVAVGAGHHGDLPHTHDHHDHDHDHAHHEDGHGHDGGWHEHEHVDLGAVASGALGWRGIVLPGLAGGVVPSPSALLVFLGGLALGRAWFGIGLVVGYGIGIAATLVTAGWLLSRAGDQVSGQGALDRFPRLARAAGYLPIATAVLVIAGGLHIAVRAVA
jgi:nickel/cobalt exporter